MLAGDAGDQFREDDRLAQAGAAEQAGLAAADQRRQEVDDLDACFEEFRLRRQVGERRRVGVDRPVLLGRHGAAAVDRFAEQVENAAERHLADRHRYRLARVQRRHAAHQTVRGAEGHAADAVAAEVLLHLADQMDRRGLLILIDAQGVIDLGQVAFFKLGVERRADDLHDLAGVVSVCVAVTADACHDALPSRCYFDPGEPGASAP